MRKIHLGAASFLAAATLAGPALAHTGGSVSSFAAGLGHPILGLDHLLAMLAVGVWSAARPAARAWQGPAVFLALLALGSALGLLGLELPLVEPGFVEMGILASVVALGAMILLAGRLPGAVGLAAIGGFALLHGHAHGTEAAGTVAGYMVGFLLASAALHLGGLGLGRLLSRLAWGLPAAGLGIGAAGLALIAG